MNRENITIKEQLPVWSVLLFAGIILVISGCSRYTGIGPSQLICKPTTNCDPEPGDTVTIIAGTIYKAGKFKRIFLGDHYRDAWTAPVQVPVIDLTEKKGRLTPLEMGGGMQTKSLNLIGGNDKFYNLRSIQKDPVVDEMAEGTIWQEIVQDQISAGHPYGAFILSPLAAAVGIYHTTPELYYLPDDPALGEFQEDFGGRLVMLEEHADEDWSNKKSFGYTENAVSTETLLEHLNEDNDHEVDQRNFLRARLFDMWIGDWDRHTGNWRWAEFEKENEKGSIFRPIPEDRDNAFCRFDGVLPWIANWPTFIRKYMKFDEDINDIRGFTEKGKYLDHRFLTKLTKEDWLAIADSMEKSLTDSVIAAAVKTFPDTIYQLNGDFFIKMLKIRRDKLSHYAAKYYSILSKDVEIVGSQKHEYFDVTRLNNSDTEVKVYKSSDNGDKEKLIYHRIFHRKETDEIRLYGQENIDFFVVKGKVKKGIKIRLIGGEGKDLMVDSSCVRGLRKLTKVYDINDIMHENEFHLGPESRDLTSKDISVNKYDFYDYNFRNGHPLLSLGFNADDGLILGGGVELIRHGFRKYPYSQYHRIYGSIATKTANFTIDYEGDFVSVFRKLGINVRLLVEVPGNITNYYGLGNETAFNKEVDPEYYHVEYNRVILDPGLKIRFGEKASLKFGPLYQFLRLRREENHFITSPEAGISNEAFEHKHYAGFKFEFTISNVRGIPYKKRGIGWIGESTWNFGAGNEESFSRLSSELEFYYTIKSPVNITLGNVIGGATNLGDYNFFQANTLGGSGGALRGFRRDRFSGRTIFYHNIELKLQLASVKLYLLPFELGVTGLFDHGRVWANNEISDKWHYNYGAGVWISPYNKMLFSFTYVSSEEENIFLFSLGITGFEF